jgi:hypothetical protein
MIKRSLFAASAVFALAACNSVYYSAMEKIGF